jgi:hypothetical protein
MRAWAVAVALLLVGAALADLPAVYLLLGDATVRPAVSLSFGFLAMGLAWAAGFELERRRLWFVKLAALAGALEIAAAFAPLGLPRWPLVASGALALTALVISLALRDDA